MFIVSCFARASNSFQNLECPMKAFLCPRLSWARGHMWAPGCGSITPDTCSVPSVHLGPTEKGLDQEWSLSLLLQPWGCKCSPGTSPVLCRPRLQLSSPFLQLSQARPSPAWRPASGRVGECSRTALGPSGSPSPPCHGPRSGEGPAEAVGGAQGPALSSSSGFGLGPASPVPGKIILTFPHPSCSLEFGV